jgi:hypothetical protein
MTDSTGATRPSGNTGSIRADHGATTETPHKAGAFDIRAFIGLLIGIYGVVLVIAGIIGPSASQLKKSDGVHVNLYAGIGMVLVSIFFLVWARMRPVVVPEEVVAGHEGTDGGAGGSTGGH